MVNAMKAARALLTFIFGWIITIIGWYTIPTFIDLTSDTTLRGIFYGGLVIIFLLLVIVIPAAMAIEATQDAS